MNKISNFHILNDNIFTSRLNSSSASRVQTFTGIDLPERLRQEAGIIKLAARIALPQRPCLSQGLIPLINLGFDKLTI